MADGANGCWRLTPANGGFAGPAARAVVGGDPADRGGEGTVYPRGGGWLIVPAAGRDAGADLRQWRAVDRARRGGLGLPRGRLVADRADGVAAMGLIVLAVVGGFVD